MNVLLVMDDTTLELKLRKLLGKTASLITRVASARALNVALAEQRFHVAICDARLSSENIYTLATRLRLAQIPGTIMLSEQAHREERLLCLSIGIDHCLAEPLDTVELGALVRNLYDRACRTLPPTLASAVNAPTMLDVRHNAWTLDVRAWVLRGPNNQAAQLSMAEQLVLQTLFEQAGEVVSRDHLTALLSSHQVRVYSRNLDAMISRLRRKSRQIDPHHPLMIRSARNVGYVFTGNGVILNHDKNTASQGLRQRAGAG